MPLPTLDFTDKMTTSSAAALVQIAAYRIDLPQMILRKILDRLQEEFIGEEWQLKFLDSHNWQALGAPMGLVAAVRSCLEEKSLPGSRDSSVKQNIPTWDVNEADASSQINWSAAAQTELEERKSAPVYSSKLMPRASWRDASKVCTSLSEIPERRGTILVGVDETLINRLNELDEIFPERSKSSKVRKSLPVIPARRDTILVDETLFNSLNELDNSFRERSKRNFLSPPRCPKRRISTLTREIIVIQNELDETRSV